MSGWAYIVHDKIEKQTVKEQIVENQQKEEAVTPTEGPVIPTYQRIGKCSQCNADVYAPEDSEDGKWVMMSACDCGSGPRVIKPSTPSTRKKQGEKPKAIASTGGAGGTYEG